MNLLTPRDVSERTSLGYRTVLRAIEDGELAAYKLRGQLRVEEAAFDAWLEANRTTERRPEPPSEPRPRDQVVGSIP